MKLEVNTERIVELMKSKGIRSKRQLADNCGIEWKTIYRLFAGRVYCKEVLWLISEELDCSINEIVKPNWERK